MTKYAMDALPARWIWAFIGTCLLIGCDSARDESDYSYVGVLGAVFLTAPASGSGSSARLTLRVEDVEYELQFHGATDFTNIKSTPSGEIWSVGAIYGVNGSVKDLVLRVDRIAQIRSATTSPAAADKKSFTSEEVKTEAKESGAFSELPVDSTTTSTQRQKSIRDQLIAEQFASLRQLCRETDDYAAQISADVERWDSEVARISSSSDNEFGSANELSLARMRAADARRVVSQALDDQARCRKRLNALESQLNPD